MSDTIDIMHRLSPSARMLGFRILKADPATGALEVGFLGQPEFANGEGNIQGGMLTAMLDDAMGPCVLYRSKGEVTSTSVDLVTRFLRPTPVGPVTVKSRIAKWGRRIIFLEGTLYDKDGRETVRATSTALVLPGAQASAG